jgi:hypothetical protein
VSPEFTRDEQLQASLPVLKYILKRELKNIQKEIVVFCLSLKG